MKTNFLYQYFYLWGGALLIPLWAIIFRKMKQSRHEMIFVGLMCGISAVHFDRFSSFYDYWQPPTLLGFWNVESFLYGFFIGGVASKAYEYFWGKEIPAVNPPHPGFVFGVAVANGVLFVVTALLLDCTSTVVYVCMLLITTAFLLVLRPRLFKESLLSGIIMMGVGVCWFTVIRAVYPSVFEDIWFIHNLIGSYLFKIPIEEYWFIFAVGTSSTLMYKVAATIGKKRASVSVLPDPHIEPIARSGIRGRLGHVLAWYGVPMIMFGIVMTRMIFFGNTSIHLSKLAAWFQ